MSDFDVFHGDADGICALHQLRLTAPRDAVLVTGTKRDITLLEAVDGHPGDSVTALDISLEANRTALMTLLERDVSVRYFDHHVAGDIPAHPGLEARIDTSPDVCTGMLVDRFLAGGHRVWAIVAAFGDNLVDTADRLAAPLALASAQLAALRELAECLNYNGYGDTLADLIVDPAELYRILSRYADPFRFLRAERILERISASRRQDIQMAHRVHPTRTGSTGVIYILPDAAWSRRIRGLFANERARQDPLRAQAVLTVNTAGGYTVSVRAPFATRVGADVLCCRFATGGGRPAAGGINHLPADQFLAFAQRFDETFC